MSQKLVLAFATLLIGVVLISSIASEALDKTDKDVAVNELHAITVYNENASEAVMYTVTYPPTSWKVADCPLTSFALKNSTGTTWTLDTDYTVNLANGTYYVLNTSTTYETLKGGTYNNSYVTYTYCADDYMNLSWGRTLLLLVSGFFAIGILLVSLGLFFSMAKDTGIL